MFARSDAELLAALGGALDALALVSAALSKARPDDPKHPGWPAGAPNSQGGKYRPKDAEEVAGDVWVRPRQPPRKSGGKRDKALVRAAKSRVQLLISLGLRAANIEAPGLGLMLEIGLDLAERAYPFIASYFDPPPTLEALQQAALDPQPGYDVHHVSEGDSARDAAEANLVNSPENQVAVPTLKHWRITGWYMTKNDEFGGLSPREYLADETWNERQQVGLNVLRKFGVLK